MSTGFEQEKKKKAAQLRAAGKEDGNKQTPPSFQLESGVAQKKAAPEMQAQSAYSASGSYLNAGINQAPTQMKAEAEGVKGAGLTQMGEKAIQAKMAEGNQPIQRMGRASKEQELPAVDSIPGDQEMAREVLEFFYPRMNPGEITNAHERLAAEMLAAAIRGSEAMDYVPRPPAVPSPSWLFQEAVKIAWRRAQSQGIYTAVRNTVAASYRSRYEMVRNGIDF